MYAGIGGLAPVLAEINQARPLNQREQALSTGIVARLTATARTRTNPSLYEGLAGDVTALRLLAPGLEGIPLDRLRSLMTPAGWSSTLELRPGPPVQATDVSMGAAGVVMAAVWAGGHHAGEIAANGGDALLAVAEPVGAGLEWAMIPGQAGKMPNYSHGTAGVASALAVAGHALDRPDFIDAARRGAEHLLAVGFLENDGFVVPHTIPPSTRDVEAVTYTWCHGPAGTSQLFAALAWPVWRRSPASAPHSYGSVVCARFLPQVSHDGSDPASGTTTVAAVAPQESATSSSTPPRTAPMRSRPTRC